jgi:UDP-N-acetylglucosamine--N-acetylmuramyl-(pentapeptide) pyrophosphoryl-undecaprenol N-acetylglucosamine transferase
VTRVLIVGGGTVGHLGPGFAVADALRRRGAAVRFATPGERQERDWFPASEPAPLATPALRRPRSALGLPGFGLRLVGAVRRTRRLLVRERPDVVVALGGWPCVPAVLAARTRAIPVAFIASDAKPGVAVRRLAGLAARIYVARESAARELGDRPSVRVTGPAIRKEVLEARADPAAYGLDPERPTLFVTGGSLGARALNEALPRGLAAAVRADPTLATRIQVLHQVGESGEGVAAIYAEAGIRSTVVRFVEHIGCAYRTATLVVARGGALTCAELAAVGTPAILVPYPHHADRQQYENAEALAAGGGARVVEEHDLGPEGVRRHVLDLLEDAAAIERMRNALRTREPDGAGQIAADLIRLVGGGRSVARKAGATDARGRDA